MKPGTINATNWAALVLRLVICGVFIYAGWEKLGAPGQFADSIAAYRLLPLNWVNPMALALPPLELITGCLLLAGWQLRAATFSALILSGLFAIALGSALWRGLAIDCGCFGAETVPGGNLRIALLRDLLLVAASLFIYARELFKAL